MNAKRTPEGNPPHFPVLPSRINLLELLKNHSAQQAAALLGMSQKTLEYNLIVLRRLDVIRRIGYGTWEVIEANKYKVYSLPTKGEKKPKEPLKVTLPRSSQPPPPRPSPSGVVKEDSIASHAFVFTLGLPSLLHWHKEGRRKYLEANNILFSSLSYGEQLVLKDWKVQLTQKSVVAYAPRGSRWHAPTAQEGYAHAVFDFLKIIQELERLLNVSLRLGKEYKVRCRREHHGFVRNALAQQYVKEGKRLAVHDERGRWLLLDLSVTEGELETHAGGDEQRLEDVRDANKRVQDFFNGIKETGITPQWIIYTIGSNTKLMNDYALNIQKHVNAVEKMTELILQLQEIFKQWPK